MSKEQLGLDVHPDGSGRPSGLCDAGCGNPASLWYGRTSAATCGANACLKIIDTQYIEQMFAAFSLALAASQGERS